MHASTASTLAPAQPPILPRLTRAQTLSFRSGRLQWPTWQFGRVSRRAPRAPERLAERHDDVDAVDPRARLGEQLARVRHADRPRASEPASRSASCSALRDDDARHLVVQAQREPVAPQRADADEQRHRRRAAEPLEEAVEVREVEDDLRHRELRACLELLLEALELDLEVVGRRVHRDADEERGRRVDRPAVEVLAAVQPRDQPREPDRVDLVDAARARVVADLGRVARDREDVADAFRVRAEQQRLEPHHGRVARRQVRDRLDAARALDRARRHHRAHPARAPSRCR